MKIIVGIGNPGKKYSDTRHNIGYRVVERLAECHHMKPWRRRFHALAVEGQVGAEKVLLLKPETFVNESGRAVKDAFAWCRVELDDVMVVCDDLNLETGRLRVRGKGSSGGHNGLTSIFEHLGSDAVARLRIGIGTNRVVDDREFVLSVFTQQERPAIEKSVGRAVCALEMWLTHGLKRCQNEFNKSSNPTALNNEEVEA